AQLCPTHESDQATPETGGWQRPGIADESSRQRGSRIARSYAASRTRQHSSEPGWRLRNLSQVVCQRRACRRRLWTDLRIEFSVGNSARALAVSARVWRLCALV